MTAFARARNTAFIMLLFWAGHYQAFAQNKTLELYVSPGVKGPGSGSFSAPFNSIEKAQAFIRGAAGKNFSAINVNLRGGTYVLQNPLVFTKEDGGTPNKVITYRAYKNETPIISGGYTLPHTWVKDKFRINLWRLKLPDSVKLGAAQINQLFADGQRLTRSSSKLFFTKGPLKQFKQQFAAFKRPDRFKTSDSLKRKNLLPYTGFAYDGNDLSGLSPADQANAEVLLYQSWDCTWQSIAKIDEVNREVYFKTSAVYPVGFFADRNRYVVENCKKYLAAAGQWCFDKTTREIYYIARSTENPNKQAFVIPQIASLLKVGADNPAAPAVQNLNFKGITFRYTLAPRGINIEAYLGKTSAASNIDWLDYSTGFSDKQGNVGCGETVLIKNANNITFDNCEFSNLGNYAIHLDRYADDNKISHCNFYSLGAGGVVIGYNHSDPAAEGIPEAASPSGNQVTSCKIHDTGLIYLSSLGIGVMNATHSKIDFNKIYNTSYSGISCGWSWGFKKISYTHDNEIQNNEIFNVLRSLTDGGGIYTLGPQHNTVIKNNLIYNIKQNKDAVGAESNGLFFDEGSSEMLIERNRIYNIEKKKIRFNATDSTKIRWGQNVFK